MEDERFQGDSLFSIFVCFNLSCELMLVGKPLNA